jgi:hypothetical protein
MMNGENKKEMMEMELGKKGKSLNKISKAISGVSARSTNQEDKIRNKKIIGKMSLLAEGKLFGLYGEKEEQEI